MLGLLIKINIYILSYNSHIYLMFMRLSSSGRGHCPFTAETGVRIPVGVPMLL
jgi:hypothetical protein